MTEIHRRFRIQQITAFAAVYLIWGSTYLAIRFAVETLPVFLMAGVRFLVAGGLLYAWARWRGAERPRWLHWRSAAIIGGLLLLGGNGSVVWAEQWLASGLAALLVGTEPLFIVFLLWLGGERPAWRTIVALVIGFAGAVLLVAPSDVIGEPIYLPAALMVLFASLSWAGGSLYSRRAEQPASPVMATALQMLAGGALLFLFGLAGGEWAEVDVATFSTTSLLALGYLTVFGSLVAFSAYSWLVRTTEPTLVATYAYINPVVAIFLGWLIASEPVGWRTVVATVMIIGSVAMLSLANIRRRPPVSSTREVEEEAPDPELAKATAGAPPRPFEKCA